MIDIISVIFIVVGFGCAALGIIGAIKDIKWIMLSGVNGMAVSFFLVYILSII